MGFHASRAVLGCLVAAMFPAFAQFSSMATDYSGDQLFFTTELSQSGAGQPDYGKLFVVDRQGLRPFLILDRAESQVESTPVPGIVTNFYMVDGVDFSSNGAMMSVMSLRTCQGISSGACRYSVQSTLWNDRGQISLVADGRVILSRNGKWGLAVLDPLSGPNTEFVLHDLTSGSQARLSNEFITNRDWWRHGIADNGTAVIATGTALQIYRGGTQQSRISAIEGAIQSAVLASDASFIVWEEMELSSGKSTLRGIRMPDGIRIDLGRPGWSDDQPHVSDDGSRILFRSSPLDGSDPQLFLMNADGSERRPVTAIPDGIAKAVFSGNGQVAWALTRAGRLVRVNIESGTIISFTEPFAAFLRPTFSFNTQNRPNVEGTPGQVLDVPASVMPGEKLEVAVDDGSQVLPVWADVVEPQSVKVQIPWNAQINPGTLLQLPRLTIRKPGSASWSGNSLDLQFFPIRPWFTSATHKEGGAPVTQQQPAHAGEVIQLSGTGFGPVDPPVADGEPAPTSPLSYLVNQIVCRTEDVVIGVTVGAEVPVLFAGLAPGQTGVYRVELRLPEVLPARTETVTVRCKVADSFETQTSVSIPRTF